MLNILVFGQSYLGKIGGVQQSYAWLYAYLCARGHRVTHVTHLPLGENGMQYPFPDAVEVRSINTSFGGNAAARVRALAREVDPDVVLVVNSSRWALEFCAPLRETPYPVILSERGSPPYCICALWKSRRLHELAVWNVDFLHMLMPSYPEALPPELRERVRVISSLTLEAARSASPAVPDASGGWTLLYTGRFSPEKQLPLLVRAFALLAPRFPQWRLRLVGEGPERGAIEAAIREAGIDDRVELPGHTAGPEHLCEQYAAGHLYCLPSSFEGCPLALREAMAHGLPVVGFAGCSGTNEIIIQNRNGLLAPEMTDRSLADSLEQLMADGRRREALGAAGRQDVKRYAPEKTHAAWEALLAEAAGWKGRKGRLRLRRCLRHPLRALWYALQPMPRVQEHMPDIFAPSPRAWLGQVPPQWQDFALLNFFHRHGLVPPAPDRAIMEYESHICHALKSATPGTRPAGAVRAKNAAALAIRHGIRLKNLYAHTPDEENC